VTDGVIPRRERVEPDALRRPLVIVGDSAFAEVSYEAFTHDSPYEVVAFAVERPYRTRDRLFDLPVVDFETVQDRFPPSVCAAFVALTYRQLNRVRARLYREAKAKGYAIASYISSEALVWRNVPIGENTYVSEAVVLQAFCQVGNNVVIWSGTTVAHHSTIRDSCFLAPRAAIAGFVEVKENTFVGINATIVNNIVVERDNWIGPGVVITRSTEPGQLYKPSGRGAPAEQSAYAFCGIDAEG
jgi:sugar O-acyltransferase (sialic acid O-acetyltransferase NeuD family)